MAKNTFACDSHFCACRHCNSFFDCFKNEGKKAMKNLLSERLPKDLSPSPFFKKLEELKRADSFLDLTVSSPIKVGICPDLKTAVICSEKEWDTWNPEAAGWNSAREAVVKYYKNRAGDFSTDRILLTSSTSEAYSILFKTFCNPGDVILTPVPGYPLLDTLAMLEQLSCYPYFLKQSKENNFVIDTDSLLSAPENAKILLLISPHNPTGHCVSEKEWQEIIAFCKERNLILVVDEVFGDYIFNSSIKRSFLFENSDVPVFWLNGLSKTVGSPEVKLGWIAYNTHAETDKIRDAMEYVADAYLSVSSMAQALSIPLLQDSLDYEGQVLLRLNENLDFLTKEFPPEICPQISGGWYAALHFDLDDEQFTLDLLEKERVLVQPGFFFDFEENGWIVVSLLQTPDLFKEGVKKIKRFLGSFE